MKPKAILGFDIDGTLTKRNTEIILPKNLPYFFRELNNLGYFFVPVTGKPSTYALRIIKTNGLEQKGTVAENASVYIKPNEVKPVIFGPNIDAITQLKNLLGLKHDERGVTKILFDRKSTETVIDPEDVSILTIFTNADAVRHKWQYKPSLTTEEIFNSLSKLINKNNLETKLQLLPPFPDGGIQVIRKNKDGVRAIDKSYLPDIVNLMYSPENTLPIAMFGDGHNDIPAMSPDSVIPITFNNSEDAVKDFVIKRRGYVSKYDAIDDIGVVDGLNWLLTSKNFFDGDFDNVSTLIKKYLPPVALP